MNTELLADLAGIQAKAFAEIEARLRKEGVGPAAVAGSPAVGSAESMLIMLGGFEHTTETNGLNVDQAAEIATTAGMDPRGAAGYYRAGLLAMTDDHRYITQLGLKRLAVLRGE